MSDAKTAELVEMLCGLCTRLGQRFPQEIGILGALLLLLHTHTHPFNGPLSKTTRVSWYQKGKTNLDFTEAIDSEWQRHQLGRVCISLQRDNRASTPPLSLLQAGCPSCRPTNSIKALKASIIVIIMQQLMRHVSVIRMTNRRPIVEYRECPA